ncbi:hypothetical protein GCM10010253_67580 [Streptomyces badius]|uniref:MACPF domain-containing protein n=1 Tax=Streptomyces badius TaxID=1941 RepID=A0ABQ2TRP4_STRBA|nr:hypothetical protein GCM10010253_67580 [Streptomyces badius]
MRWAVSGAARFALYEANGYGGPSADASALAEGEDVGKLTFTPPADGSDEQYVVVAYDATGTPVDISQVGVGDPRAVANVTGKLDAWEKDWKEATNPKKESTEKGTPKEEFVNGFKRTTQHMSIVRNPQEVIMFNPNHNMLFPGALVRGNDGVRRGQLVPAGVSDSDRADVKISIDRVSTKTETCAPTLSGVRKAIGTIVGEDICPTGGVYYASTTANTSVEASLQLGVSASYGGFAASLEAKMGRKEYQNTVAVVLKERAFSVSCDNSTPEALFKESFTQEKLESLCSASKPLSSRWHALNPPMLVLAVHYGRTLVFTLTSSASETEIEAAVKASYNGFASASAEVKARYQSVLKTSSIQIIAQGVDVDVLRELANGSIAKIFDKTHKFKEYMPLGYTLATLKGEVTKMSEATEYDAVSWGGMRVELEIPSIWLGMATTDDFDITVNGTVYKARKNQPARVTRTFENDGTGAPFHVTNVKGSSVDWKLGPYDLKWFESGPTHPGKYPEGEEITGTAMKYTATRG